MSTPQLVILIAGLSLGAFATRFAMIAIFGRTRMPIWLDRYLKYVPVAVLTAIALPNILVRDGTYAMHLGNARLFAAILAVVVAWRTRNMLMTIAAGMLCVWVLQWVGLR